MPDAVGPPVMPAFYHVDRAQTLHLGQEIQLSHNGDAGGLIKEMYPDGFSRFGREYTQRAFVGPKAAPGQQMRLEMNALHDAVVELVRRDRYPNKPSRFQSLFCYGDLSSATQFIHERSDYPVTVWEIEDDRDHRGDAELLEGTNFTDGVRKADQYWSGHQSAHPDWEVLIRLPTDVTRKVAEVAGPDDLPIEDS